MSERIRIGQGLMDAYGDEVRAWAEANGIDPDITPVPSVATFDGSTVTVEQYVRGKVGLLIDVVRSTALRTTVTVPLVEAFPAAAFAYERLRNEIEGQPAYGSRGEAAGALERTEDVKSEGEDG